MAPLVAVTTTCWDMEYSVHACPKQYTTEVKSVFPNVDTQQLLLVPTCQRSGMDLVNMGARVDDEKDRLLERFMLWSSKVCELLIARGHWADYIDPCSGLPMVHKDTNTVYGEVESLSILLGYKTANAGCCKILLHPKWGSSVYPATMFTTAPVADLLSCIKEVEAVC